MDSTEAPSIDALFERARAGDQQAWFHLVDRCAGSVHAAVRSAGVPADEVDDAEQAAWVILHRNMDSVRHPGALVSWIATTAVREAHRARRRRQSRRHAEDRASEDHERPLPEDPEDVAARVERIVAVRDGLERIGSPCNELLTRLFGGGDDASYNVVAEELGMSVGSIGPTRARCMAKLARILDPRLGEDE